jgi:hypothetical protein
VIKGKKEGRREERKEGKMEERREARKEGRKCEGRKEGTHAHNNPSYLAGRDQEDCSLKPVWANTLGEPLL